MISSDAITDTGNSYTSAYTVTLDSEYSSTLDKTGGTEDVGFTLHKEEKRTQLVFP
jgi:hypothetical protein